MDTGFNIFEQQPHLQPAPAAPRARRRRWRRALLASAAMLAVAGAGAAFLLSPYNTVFPLGIAFPLGTVSPGSQVRQPPSKTSTQTNLPAAADASLAPVVAPAARLAGVPRQEKAPVARGTVAPADLDAQTREILGLRGGSDKQPSASTVGTEERRAERSDTAPSPKPAGPAAPAVSEVGVSPLQPPPLPAPPVAAPAPPQAELKGMEPGMVAPAPPAPANPAPSAVRLSPAVVDPARIADEADTASPPPQKQDSADVTQSVPPAPSALATPVVTVVAPPTTAPSPPALADPVGVGMALRPKPMARDEQIDVLHVVAQLATMIRDLRVENAGLRASTKDTSDKVDSAVADFERRLALAESRVAVKAAMADMDAPPEPAAPAPVAARTLRRAKAAAAQPAASPAAHTPIAVAPAVPAGAARYKVQAASPGLAMLSELDRSGGEGSQVQVKVGDQVPGFGRVVAIQQQGVAWTVKTERGAIQ